MNDNQHKERFIKILKSIVVDVLKKTTAHGIPSLLQDIHIVMKVIWAFCILLSSCACFYLISIGFISYYRYDTYISSTTIQEIPTNFPAITICNTKFLNKVKAETYINKSVDIQKDFARITPLSKNLEVYGQYFWKAFIESYILQTAVSRDSNLTTSERISLGFELSDMLLFCRFNWKTCNQSDFSFIFNSFYGNCYTFNGENTVNGSTLEIKKVSEPSASNGLSLELFTGNPNVQSQNEFKSDGFFVFIHNQSNPSLLNSKSILVPTGAETNLKVKRNFISRLSSPYGNCLSDVSIASEFSSQSFDYIVKTLYVAYTQEFCYSICLQSKIVNVCNCNAWYLPSYGNQSLCSSTNECWKSTHYLVTRNNLSIINDCVSQCPLECNSIEYEVSTSSLAFPNRYYRTLLAQTSAIKSANVSLDDINSSVLRFNLFYETLAYTIQRETASMDAFTIMSNFGGTLGLFLGVSFLSFIELFELVYRLLHAIIEARLALKVKNEFEFINDNLKKNGKSLA